ncbi:MAG: thiamine diphosphokinase [Anaerolineales bacterium]|nr:thiamine diphosphokinase [Anaerolineales bacterium]
METPAIVVGNGEIGQRQILRRRLKTIRAPLVIAANGGSRLAQSLDLQVDVVIGDLDSLDPESKLALTDSGATFELSAAEKDETDLELALLYAASRGARQIIVLGAIGGRMDMTLANVLLLTHPRLSTTRIQIWHEKQTAWLIRPPGEEIEGDPGDTLSLIPLSTDATGISTHHLAYPMSGDDLAFGPARGISNVITGPVARVDLKTGMLLAVHTPGRA